MSGEPQFLNLSVPYDTPHLDVLTLAHRNIRNLLRVETFKLLSVGLSGEKTVVNEQEIEGLTYRIKYVRVGKSGLLN